MFILKVQKFVDNGGWSSDTVRTGLGKGVTVARRTLVIGKITLVVSRKREVGRCHHAVVCLFWRNSHDCQKLVHKGNFDPWPIVSSDAVSKAKPAELADL